MTEADWLACTDPKGMVEFVDEKASDRKKRLFAAACCRRIWSMMTDHRSQMAVEVAERFADGLANRSEWEAAIEAALSAREDNLEAAWELFDEVLGANPQADLPGNHALAAAVICVTDKEHRLATGIDEAYRKATRRPGRVFKGKTTWMPDTEYIPEEGRDNSDLIRELFGNPFRPVTLDAAWQTPTVLALATAAYDNRILPAGTLEPARLNVLADALEEAGCDNADILNHCRQPGEHVRGCWVLDLILGKE
jgi:hypothetical protein